VTEKEIRTFTIKYRDKQINISVALEDTVTIRVGDWYFEGEVKSIYEKETIHLS
jgi:hypothetical protein